MKPLQILHIILYVVCVFVEATTTIIFSFCFASGKLDHTVDQNRVMKQEDVQEEGWADSTNHVTGLILLFPTTCLPQRL